MDQIGSYPIQGAIISNGLGRLFLAVDPSSQQTVVLKQLPQDFLADEVFRSLFIQEMQAWAEIGHPGIIPVDVKNIEGVDYLVRRWVGGGTLAERLAKGPIGAQATLSILHQLAEALDAAHARGLLHRNLKPENILFDENGMACLVDYGLVQRSSACAQAALNWISGAPGTISPEAALGHFETDGRSDVYAMGALAFHMLTGQQPYAAATPVLTALQHVTGERPDLASLRRDLPGNVVLAVNRCLAKNPAERFASARQFVEAFEGAFKYPKRTPEWEPVSPMGAAIPVRRRKSRWEWVMLGVTGVLLAALVVLYLGGSPALKLVGIDLPEFVISLGATATLSQATAPTVKENTPAPMIPSSTPTVIPPQATSTPLATATNQATRTPSPTATDLPTTTPAPRPPEVGGGDLLAFINANDLWVVNLDGSGLTRLTEDEQPKTDLQWTPDGNALTYSSNDCYYSFTYSTWQISQIGCFEDFEISGDMQQVIIGGRVILSNGNWSWMNFLSRFDLGYLKELSAVPQQSSDLGQSFIGGRHTRFSATGDVLAAVFNAPQDGRQVQLIQVFRLAGMGGFDILDTFPANRFRMNGYSGQQNAPEIDDFGWNGEQLFTLHGNVLHGYGDLVLYNMQTGRGEVLNPIDGRCCYQDIQFSPDGQYLLFAFQDNEIGQGAQIYLVPLGMIGSGVAFTPIELPYYFFNDDSQARVEPALRPVQR